MQAPQLQNASSSSPTDLSSDAGIPARPRRGYYRAELDALRFIAFFLVLVHHTMPLGIRDNAAWSSSLAIRSLFDSVQLATGFGLSLFFSLSAYLIVTLLLKERESTGTVRLKAFYIRRILRIWPLYLLALAAGFARSYTGRMQHYPLAFACYLFLAGNWYCSFFGFPMNPILPLWSISVEEQFYLFIPGCARRGGRRLLVIVAGVMFASSWIALAVLVHLRANRADSVWTNSFVQFGTFASGMALAVWTGSQAPAKLGRATQILLVLLAGLVFLGCSSVLQIDSAGPASSWFKMVLGYSAVSLASGLCIYAFLVRPWNPGPVLVYLGKISYGLYVFHSWSIGVAKLAVPRAFRGIPANSPQYFVALLAVAFVLSVMLASASYRFVEMPFLRIKDRFSFVHSRPL